ncbi:MAG: selenocysteine lyase, partial [bacterium]
MTKAINKFHRLLQLKMPKVDTNSMPIDSRPIVFISHMEHHSNQTTWEETNARVIVVPPSES